MGTVNESCILTVCLDVVSACSITDDMTEAGFREGPVHTDGFVQDAGYLPQWTEPAVIDQDTCMPCCSEKCNWDVFHLEPPSSPSAKCRGVGQIQELFMHDTPASLELTMEEVRFQNQPHS